MKKGRSVLSKILSVLSVLIFAVGIVIFISVLSAAGGKVPSVLGYSVMQVRSGSMEPELMTGTVVIVRKTDVHKLEKGDVISFYMTSGTKMAGSVNTHRIVEVNHLPGGSPVFVTKGDNNDDVDPDPVHSLSVIGKVVYNLGTVSGSFVSVIQNPKVIFFVIVLPLLFITFGEAVNLVNLVLESKKDKNEEEINLEQTSEKKD